MAGTKYVKIDKSLTVNADMQYRLKNNLVSFVVNRSNVIVMLKRKGKEVTPVGWMGKGTIEEFGLINELRNTLLTYLPSHRIGHMVLDNEYKVKMQHFKDVLICIETITMGKEVIKNIGQTKR